jgi:hypothetical protein
MVKEIGPYKSPWEGGPIVGSPEVDVMRTRKEIYRENMNKITWDQRQEIRNWLELGGVLKRTAKWPSGH